MLTLCFVCKQSVIIIVSFTVAFGCERVNRKELPPVKPGMGALYTKKNMLQ